MINGFAHGFNLENLCLHLLANFHTAGVKWRSILNRANNSLEVPRNVKGIHAHLHYKAPKIFRAGAGPDSDNEFSPVE
jgi:hypothetical protein